MQYQTCEITGYVYNIKSSRFGMKIYLQSEKDETGIKYPQHMLATVNNKQMDVVDPSLKIGDKVWLKIVPWLSEGVSKSTGKAYSVSDIRVVECRILESGAVKPNTLVDDDSPF